MFDEGVFQSRLVSTQGPGYGGHKVSGNILALFVEGLDSRSEGDWFSWPLGLYLVTLWWTHVENLFPVTYVLGQFSVVKSL